MDNIVCGGFSVSQRAQFRKYTLKKIHNIFRHLELEIASAILAPNDEKYS